MKETSADKQPVGQRALPAAKLRRAHQDAAIVPLSLLLLLHNVLSALKRIITFDLTNALVDS